VIDAVRDSHQQTGLSASTIADDNEFATDLRHVVFLRLLVSVCLEVIQSRRKVDVEGVDRVMSLLLG